MTGISLGLRPNIGQFVILVVINAFVGSMVGFYSLIPLIGQREYGLISNIVILSYVMGFGITKAFCNFFAGRLADKWGRKKVLIFGWLFGIPVPIVIILAPNWWWIVLANILLGINQGFAWSMTVVMKIDLVGPARRGLAMGLNEFAGYLSVSITLLVSGHIAAAYSLRPEPFYLAIGFTGIGLALSVLKTKETKYHAALEADQTSPSDPNMQKNPTRNRASRNIFLFTTLRDSALSSSCLAGLINNLIFGMSWGLFPLFFASYGVDVGTINYIKAFYPGVWGLSQLVTGPLSDKLGRKWLIVSGQIIQAIGIWFIVFSTGVTNWIIGDTLIGLGTAFVYPTLLAAVSDVSSPAWRSEALGTYRFWRDIGYAVGAIVGGIVADLFNIPFAINMVAVLTFASALLVAFRMYETSGKTPVISSRYASEAALKSRYN